MLSTWDWTPQPSSPAVEGLEDAWRMSRLESILEGQRSWGQMSVKDGGSSSHGSNRVGALTSKGPRQVGKE